mmetsp:Transcript_72402/g.106119  ORF Transcript_72402/g.106119 Transcript_72402/m.106119 type:complete len:251 (+) Transcript_72402:432-1184(+)
MQFLILAFFWVCCLCWQMEEQRNQVLEKTNSKLKSTMTEMHTKHVAGMNILQAKIGALEKELDAERTTAVTLQSKLQIEARQKRRLEDDYALLENRRVLRQNFVAQALKPSSTRAIEGPAHGGASGVVRGVGGGGEGGRGHLGGYAGARTSHINNYQMLGPSVQSQMVARMTQGEDRRAGEGSSSGKQGTTGGDGGRFQDPSPGVEGAGGRSGKENTRGGEGRHGSHLLGGGSLPGGDETKRMLFHFGSS